jgi:hypothetical protein
LVEEAFMSRALRLALGAIALAGISSSASATIMVEVPLDEMIQRADLVVHGTVIRTDVVVSLDGPSPEPQTITTLRVREWLGGGTGETVRIRELGGSWQGRTLRYDGTPEYRVGEEVVVFLERRPEAPNDLRTFAMVQGKFVVQHGVPGVPSSVSRDLAGISFYRWAEGQQRINAPGAEPAMELETFLDFVRRTRGRR